MAVSERQIGPIEVRWGSDQYKYSIVGDSFFTEWKNGMDFSKSSWPLHGVSPHFGETIGRSSDTTKTVRISAALIAAAIIIFFSEYNKSIPLLAPFLFGLGCWWLIGKARNVVPRSWTEVRKTTGEDFFSFVQPSEKSEDWIAFEQALSKAIHEINTTQT